MPDLIPITSLDDPRVVHYRNQKDAWLRAGAISGNGTGLPDPSLFIAEGDLVVRELIRSRFKVRSVLASPARAQAMADALEGLDAPVYAAEPHILSKIVGFDLHRGVLAVAERGPELDAAALARAARVAVILEDLTNHDNVGAIFRITAALAPPGSCVLLTPACADPLYRKALRVSMGQALRVPFAVVRQWPDVSSLRAAGLRVLALTPGSDAKPVTPASGRTDRLAVVVGTEGRGLSQAAALAADERIRIHMSPGVDSLNVGVALAVALAFLVPTDCLGQVPRNPAGA